MYNELSPEDKSKAERYFYIQVMLYFLMLTVFIPMLVIAFFSRNIHVYNTPITTIIVCSILISNQYNILFLNIKSKIITLGSILLSIFYLMLISSIIVAKIADDPSVISGAFGLAILSLFFTVYFFSSIVLCLKKSDKFHEFWGIILFLMGSIAAITTGIIAFINGSNESIKWFVGLASLLVLFVIPMKLASLIYNYKIR